jgi:hypothetical protein
MASMDLLMYLVLTMNCYVWCHNLHMHCFCCFPVMNRLVLWSQLICIYLLIWWLGCSVQDTNTSNKTQTSLLGTVRYSYLISLSWSTIFIFPGSFTCLRHFQSLFQSFEYFSSYYIYFFICIVCSMRNLRMNREKR